MEFEQRIKYLLEINKMTQSDLSKKTGIPSSLIANYCGGKKSPAITNAILIAEAFNITLDELVDRKNNKNELQSQLRNGIGEPFNNKYELRKDLSDLEKEILSKFNLLTDKDRKSVENIIDSLYEKNKK